MNVFTKRSSPSAFVRDRWAESSDGMTLIPQADGTTILSGRVADQAGVQGVLRRVADLGMTLLSVNALGLDELCQRCDRGDRQDVEAPGQ